MWISLSVNAMLVLLSITASEKEHESNSHAEYDSDLIFTISEEGTLEETSRPSAEMERKMSSVVANSEVPNFTSESHEASTRVSGSHATTSLPSSADESSTRDSGSHVPIVTSELHRTIRGGDVNDSLTAATHADMSKHTHPTTRSTDSIIISTPADIPATTSPNIAVLPPEAITTSAPITDTSTVPIAISVNHTNTLKSVGHTSVPTSNSHINASTPNSHTSAPSPTTFTHTTSNFETISEQESSPITIPPLTPPSSTHSARTQVENSSTAAEASRPLHTSTSDNFIQATLLLERNSLYQKRDDDDGIMVVLAIGLLLILLLILILAVLITAILVTKNQRKRKPVEDAERKSAAVYKIYDPTKRPRLMKAADMRKMHFEYKGALVLQPKLEGPVRNDCEDVGSLHTVTFDPNLNEVVDIGSDVEVLNMHTTGTTDGGDTTISLDSKKKKTKSAKAKSAKNRLSRTKSSNGRKRSSVNAKGPKVKEAKIKSKGKEGTQRNSNITPIR